MSHLHRFLVPSVLAGSFCAPAFAVAAGVNTTELQTDATAIITFVNNGVVPALLAIAFAVFLWGVVKYFFIHGAEDAEREKGRWFIMWGIIGFVVILAVWGLVAIVRSTLGLSTDSGSPKPPTFNSTGTSNSSNILNI